MNKSSIIKVLVFIVCLIIIVNLTFILKEPTTENVIINGFFGRNRKKLLILIADKGLFNKKVIDKPFEECPLLDVKCEITTDKSLSKESDGILFFIPRTIRKLFKDNYVNITTRSNSKQLYFGWSMESPIQYPSENNEQYLSNNFNITIGYTRNKYQLNQELKQEDEDEEFNEDEDLNESHIYTPYGPYPYSGSDHYAYMFKFGELKEIPKKRLNNIMWMAGNCQREKIGRTELVEMMMKFTHINSFGHCLHNTDLKYNPGVNVINRSKQKLRLLKKFNFVIAIENSRCESYVTEKLWEPLSQGTIPIYLGATDINRFLPHPDSIINIADFNSVASLMNYVDQVGKNETLRIKHLQWITKPYPNHFKLILKQSKNNQNNLFCNICKKLENVDKNSHVVYSPVPKPFKRCIGKRFNISMY